MNLSAFNHTKMLGCIRTFKTAAKSFRKILKALNEWFHACNLGVMVKKNCQQKFKSHGRITEKPCLNQKLSDKITYSQYSPAVKGTLWNRFRIGLKDVYLILLTARCIGDPYAIHTISYETNIMAHLPSPGQLTGRYRVCWECNHTTEWI